MTDTETAKVDTSALRKLAAKAPEGPWFAAEDPADDAKPHKGSGLALVDTGRQSDWPIARLTEWNTASYLAAVDPQTVLALLARAEAAEAALADFDGEAQRAWAALTYYGAHRADCSMPDGKPWPSGRPCSCGFDLCREVHMFPPKSAPPPPIGAPDIEALERSVIRFIEGYKLPCRVSLPPATMINKGASLRTLYIALRQREGYVVTAVDPGVGPDHTALRHPDGTVEILDATRTAAPERG